jgi:hypothetical protein
MKRPELVIVTACMVLAGCSSGDSARGSSPKPGSGDSTVPAAAKSSAGSASSAIPASPVIDDLLKSSNPKRFDLVAKCNEVAVVVLGSSMGINDDPKVRESLDRLVSVARQYDQAVADALAKDAKAAAAWCKATGMTNS